MGRIRNALDALFDRAAKNAPQPGSVQTSFQLATLLGLNFGAGSNAENPTVQIKEGFNKNVVVNRCVSTIARSAASVKLVLYRKKTDGDLEEIPSHPLLALLDRPNPRMGRAEFLETWISYFVLTGNTFAHAITVDRGKRVKELWPLVPSVCEPVVTRGMLTAYQVQTEGGAVTFPVDPVTGVCEILHAKTWNPSDPFRGQSPMMAAALSTDVHNMTSEWTRALLENSATPSGALVQKAAQGGIPNKLTDPEFERLKAELQESYSGAVNAGRPLLLEGGLDWTPMGLSPKDMDWLNARNTTAREISLAFGVPPMLLGIAGDNTYSNQKEARLALWEDTVLPTLGLVLSSLNRFVENLFPGAGLFIGYDEDSVPALAFRRESVWANMKGAEFLSVDEKREALGYEATEGEGGNTILVSGSLKPLEQAIQEPPDPVELAAATAAAKRPPAPEEGANDNARVPAAARAATRSMVLDLRRDLGAGRELKYSDPQWRNIEIDARNRILSSAETQLRGKVRAHLLGTARLVADALKAGDYANVDNVVLNTADDLEQILSVAYYAVAEVVSDRFLAAFKGTKAPERKDLLSHFWTLISEFVDVHTAKQVTQITETTRQEIAATIGEGLKQGLSMTDIASMVMATMRTASASRAITIASTEAHTASSFAAESSARSVGVEMEREWAAAGGERTRPSHARADGQRRMMDEPFHVGSSSLDYPGDPAGPAHEVINCRCAVLYHPTGL